MTYDVYALFTEGAYLVASGNNQDHAADLAERVCKSIGQWPMAMATLTRGEHVLNCNQYDFNALKKRGRQG